MRILSVILVLLTLGCAPRVLTAWSKDEMVIDVLMLKNQGWQSIVVDTLEDGRYHIRYK